MPCLQRRSNCKVSKNLIGQPPDMSHNLNSLKGDYVGDCIGGTIGVIKGDTRSFVQASLRHRSGPAVAVSGSTVPR